jgi:hypothetical protein
VTKRILGPSNIFAKTAETEESPPAVQPTKDEQLPQSSSLGAQYIIEQERLKYVEFEQGVQPSRHDRRHRQSYAERMVKVNFSVDARIYPYFKHALLHGPGISQQDNLNRLALEWLVSKGYPIDPGILDRTFRDEDVPKPQR